MRLNRSLACLSTLSLLGFGVVCAPAAEQGWDFDHGVAGLTLYDPIGTAISQQIIFPSFQTVNGSTAYNLRADHVPPYTLDGPPTPPNFGPTRGGLLWTDLTLTDFTVTVDIVAWDDTKDQSFGVLARIGNVSLGQTTGYVFNYNNGDKDFEINRITGEQPVNLSRQPLTSLTVGNAYRFVFSGTGANFTGQIFNASDLSFVAGLTATDATYASGYTGLLLFDNAPSAIRQGANVTYDNLFVSTVPIPEPATWSLMGLAAIGLALRIRGRKS